MNICSYFVSNCKRNDYLFAFLQSLQEKTWLLVCISSAPAGENVITCLQLFQSLQEKTWLLVFITSVPAGENVITCLHFFSPCRRTLNDYLLTLLHMFCSHRTTLQISDGRPSSYPDYSSHIVLRYLYINANTCYCLFNTPTHLFLPYCPDSFFTKHSQQIRKVDCTKVPYFILPGMYLLQYS
jgi:hypothetical protein